MRKFILLLIMLVFLPAALAELKVSLLSYNVDSGEARILVGNIGKTDHTELSFSIDDSAMEFKGSILNPGNGFVVIKNVQPGLHKVQVTTKEGNFEQKLLFARLASSLPENIIVKGLEQEYVVPDLPEEQERHTWLYIIIVAILLLAAGGAVYFYLHPQKWKALLEKLHIKKPVQKQPVYQQRFPQVRYPIQKPITRTEKKVERTKLFEKFGGKK